MTAHMAPVITFREAVREDLDAIIALLAHDPLGQTREDASLPLDHAYVQAFNAISADPNAMILAACRGDEIVGTLQINILAHISFTGSTRGQIESVRIREDQRGSGLGQQMLAEAERICRTRGCGMIQLAMNTTRTDAHRFYERLGFQGTHVGFKKMLA